MNKLISLKNLALSYLLMVVATGASLAQNNYKESFRVGDDVLVSVNTTHTNVVFETWNQDKVEVEAYIEGEDLSAEEKQEIFDNWSFDVLGNSKKVVITSNEGSLWGGFESLGSLEALKGLERLEGLESLKSLEGLAALEGLKVLPNFDFNFDFNFPDVPEMGNFPAWPFSDDQPAYRSGNNRYNNLNFNSGNRSISFDMHDYRKDKQGYVDKWNREYGTNVSVSEVDQWVEEVEAWADNLEEVMEDWGRDFGEQMETKFGPEFEMKMEKWGEEFGKSMEKWGESFGEDMEKWGEELGKDMEKWAEEFEKGAEEWAKQFEDGNYSKETTIDENGNKSTIIRSNGRGSLFDMKKAVKKIIIRMPKGTKTDINVRHGEVKMADVHNVRATLNYSEFSANSIDGGDTSINAAYGPVYVNNWIDGMLEVKYVDDCKLNRVRDIELQANSSDVNINDLARSAILSGSFGNLFINDIDDDFESVDIILENTDANIHIPNTSFSFYFSGKKSELNYPKSMQLSKTGSAGRQLFKGYNGSKNSGRSLNINASYSRVIIE